MKGIILAAGQGTRMRPYTEETPKAMLEFDGVPILERIVSTMNECGIDDIVVIRGYLAEKVDVAGVRYYENERFDRSNMVETLFCAEEELDDEFILSYADILFEQRVLEGLLSAEGDHVVTVDTDWEQYWNARYGTIDHDVESLVMDQNSISSLGVPDVTVDEIDGRYVGLMKFSKRGARTLREVYQEAKEEYGGNAWQQSGNVFREAYMTDLLQELIDRDYTVDAHTIEQGWLEFDTTEDYDQYHDWLEEGSLDRFYSPHG